VRPILGRQYYETNKNNQINTEGFFDLIKEYKSEFAYSLLLNLKENINNFNIPPYIIEGIKFLK
jgi:hypothetical protein